MNVFRPWRVEFISDLVLVKWVRWMGKSIIPNGREGSMRSPSRNPWPPRWVCSGPSSIPHNDRARYRVRSKAGCVPDTMLLPGKSDGALKQGDVIGRGRGKSSIPPPYATCFFVGGALVMGIIGTKGNEMEGFFS